jgi:hypothetical protein
MHRYLVGSIVLLALALPSAATTPREDCGGINLQPHPDTPAVLGAAIVPYPAIDPRRVVQIFLQAVDRGELVVFGEPLTRADIDPQSVDYSFTLGRRLPRILIHSRLEAPFPLPGAPGVRVTAVTGELTADGRILESTLHCE